MDQTNNFSTIARRFWDMVRAAIFAMRQGVCKKKLMLELNLTLKRGKLAGKSAVKNLIFNHHRHVPVILALHHRHVSSSPQFAAPPAGEYEFSCSNSPANPFKKAVKHALHFPCAHAPLTDDDGLDAVTVNSFVSETASPALPGFGGTPLVRQLRVSDSPFPLRDGESDCHVDEAAEKFISKFHSYLRRQSLEQLNKHN